MIAPTEENIQNHRARVRRLRQTKDMLGMNREKNPRTLIDQALAERYKNIQAEDRARLVQKVLVNPDAEKIKAGDKVEIYDTFLFDLAASIERINCETSTQNEYFTWIEECQSIMKHMTDGEITDDDLEERKTFLYMSFQRETELLTCLGLYERSMALGNKQAEEKYKELRYKMQKLREMRSCIQTNTRSEKEHKPTMEQREEAAKARMWLMMVYEAGDRPTQTQLMQLDQKASELGISHRGDVEFIRGYSYYTRLLENVRHADRWEREGRIQGFGFNLSYNNTPSEYLYLTRHDGESKENVRALLERLSGRRTNNALPEYNSSHMRRRALTQEAYRAALERIQQRSV